MVTLKFNMASYIAIMKKYALNKNVSNEDFVRELFLPFITAGNVQDKNGEQLELNKSRVSRLLAQKDDVPMAMRSALSLLNIADRTAEGFADFLADNIDDNHYNDIVTDISDLINTDFLALTNQNDNSRFLSDAFIEAVKADNVAINNSNTTIWHNGGNSINVLEGDLFKFAFENRSKTVKNIVVIPVNTAFDTHVSTQLEADNNPLVSENTLHGQWLIRWIKSGQTIDELDKRIAESLTCQGEKSIEKAKSKNGKQDCYEIGTTAIVDIGKAVFYLCAIASFDECNNAQTTPEKIKESIANLLKLYDKKGQGYTLYMPLLGTGRSRSGMDYQKSFDLIKQTLLQNKHQIQGHIAIVVEPDVLQEIVL